MINFAIPGFYEHTKLNISLIKLLKDYPEKFYKDININACFGNFQFCIWDGGRTFVSYKQASKEQINNIYHQFDELNIPIRFIFTNNQIVEHDCYDRFCNLILTECNNGINEIVINHPILEKYIRTNYPGYSLISSTTKCLTDLNELKNELNFPQYKMVCLDYNLNHNYKFLENLTLEEKNKCEFLVNPICGAACPNRKEHYKLNSLFNKNYGLLFGMEQCNIRCSTFSPKAVQLNNQITINEIMNYYNEQGFSNFKIEGRSWPSYELAITYVNYFVLPEYKNEILMTLLNNILKED